MTDFGTDNLGTAAMRGVCASVCEDLKLADLTNNIEPFNVWQASDALLYAEPFWPKGTVFVSVVDPGVGTSRRACVAKLKDGNFVVTPDNGTLTHMAAFVGIEEVRQIDETTNRLQTALQTSIFHGRDLFAYCGARLAANVITYEQVGPGYPVSEIVKCPKPVRASWDGDTAYGDVTTVSVPFGNVFTNILVDDLVAHGYQINHKYHLIIQNEEETLFDGPIDYVKSFGFTKEGTPLIVNGSTLCLSIAVNRGSFLKEYGLDPRKDWKVILSKD